MKTFRSAIYILLIVSGTEVGIINAQPSGEGVDVGNTLTATANTPVIIGSPTARSKHAGNDRGEHSYGLGLHVQVSDPQGLDDIATVTVIDSRDTVYTLADENKDGWYDGWPGLWSQPPPLGAYRFRATDKSGNWAEKVDSVTAILDYPRNVRPAHGEVISEDAPIFSWSQIAGAIKYWVKVADINGNQIWFRDNIQETSIRYNDDGTGLSLKDGNGYGWVVNGYDSDGNFGEQYYWVIFIYDTNFNTRENRLFNPSFENFTGTSGVADYWTFFQGHQASTSASNEAKEGSHSQRIDVSALVPPGPTCYVVLSQPQEYVQLRGKQKNRFSFWAKGKGRIVPSITLNRYEYVKWGKITTLTPYWQFFEITFTTPDTVKSIDELIRFDDNMNFGGTIESGDWVLIDEASLEGPLIQIERVTALPSILEPGNSVTITAHVLDAGRGTSSVKAKIESADETNQATIELFDDGTHGDKVGDDKIFGNTWTTLTTPMNYIVDIVVTDGSLHTTTIDNAAVFSTLTSSLPLQLTTDPGSDYNASVLQTRDGRVWLFWNSNRNGIAQIWCKNST